MNITTEYLQRIQTYLVVFSVYLLATTIYIYMRDASTPSLIILLLLLTLALISIAIMLNKAISQPVEEQNYPEFSVSGLPSYDGELSATVSQIVSDPERLIAIKALYTMQKSQDSQTWHNYLINIMENPKTDNNVANSEFENIRRNIEVLIRNEMMKEQLV